MSDSGPAITISAHQLQREASEAILLAQAMRDRAQPGARQDIPAALIARDRLRALIWADVAHKLDIPAALLGADLKLRI